MTEKKKVDLHPLLRFLEVLPKSGDKELALLKAHLVIEEVLTKIICRAVLSEKHIHDARLSFHQKCNVARAIDELKDAPWVWQALKLLNQARNELSHNLTTAELNAKIEAFTEHVKVHNSKLFESGSSEKFTEFHMAAFATYMPIAVHANFDPANIKMPSLLGEYNA